MQLWLLLLLCYSVDSQPTSTTTMTTTMTTTVTTTLTTSTTTTSSSKSFGIEEWYDIRLSGAKSMPIVGRCSNANNLITCALILYFTSPVENTFSLKLDTSFFMEQLLFVYESGEIVYAANSTAIQCCQNDAANSGCLFLPAEFVVDCNWLPWSTKATSPLLLSGQPFELLVPRLSSITNVLNSTYYVRVSFLSAVNVLEIGGVEYFNFPIVDKRVDILLFDASLLNSDAITVLLSLVADGEVTASISYVEKIACVPKKVFLYNNVSMDPVIPIFFDKPINISPFATFINNSWDNWSKEGYIITPVIPQNAVFFNTNESYMYFLFVHAEKSSVPDVVVKSYYPFLQDDAIIIFQTIGLIWLQVWDETLQIVSTFSYFYVLQDTAYLYNIAYPAFFVSFFSTLTFVNASFFIASTNDKTTELYLYTFDVISKSVQYETYGYLGVSSSFYCGGIVYFPIAYPNSGLIICNPNSANCIMKPISAYYFLCVGQDYIYGNYSNSIFWDGILYTSSDFIFMTIDLSFPIYAPFFLQSTGDYIYFWNNDQSNLFTYDKKLATSFNTFLLDGNAAYAFLTYNKEIWLYDSFETFFTRIILPPLESKTSVVFVAYTLISSDGPYTLILASNSSSITPPIEIQAVTDGKAVTIYGELNNYKISLRLGTFSIDLYRLFWSTFSLEGIITFEVALNNLSPKPDVPATYNNAFSTTIIFPQTVTNWDQAQSNEISCYARNLCAFTYIFSELLFAGITDVTLTLDRRLCSDKYASILVNSVPSFSTIVNGSWIYTMEVGECINILSGYSRLSLQTQSLPSLNQWAPVPASACTINRTSYDSTFTCTGVANSAQNAEFRVSDSCSTYWTAGIQSAKKNKITSKCDWYTIGANISGYSLKPDNIFAAEIKVRTKSMFLGFVKSARIPFRFEHIPLQNGQFNFTTGSENGILIYNNILNFMILDILYSCDLCQGSLSTPFLFIYETLVAKEVQKIPFILMLNGDANSPNAVLVRRWQDWEGGWPITLFKAK